MKKLLQKPVYFCFLVVIGFLSCKKPPINNIPPVARAGQNQTVILPKDSAVLDATASKDPDGIITTYLWMKIDGPASFTIVNAAAPTTIVRSLVQGIYQFELKVTDKEGSYSKDTVQITVTSGDGTNQPPVANAGADQTIILPVSFCTLNGNRSYDPDGSIEAYQWTKLGGPSSYAIQNPTAVQTIVNNLSEGIYSFELTVTDNGGLIAKDIVLINIEALPVGCNGSLPSFNVSLAEIGNLSDPRTPSVAGAGSKIVFAGGTNRPGENCPGMGCNTLPSSAIDIYDVYSHIWSAAQLSQPRQGMGAVSCGNKIFFAGGANFELYFNNGIVYDNVDIYDVSTNTWTIAHLSKPRTAITAASLGNKVFFAGGSENGMYGSTRVDIYDVSTNSWSTAELSVPRYTIDAVVDGNKIYFVGGDTWDENWGDVSRIIDIYDVSTNGWSTSTLEQPYYTITDVMVGNTNYWIYYSGTNQVKIKNMSTGAETEGCAPYPYQGTFSANDDIILASTYSSGGGSFIGSAIIYNTVTGQWSVGLLNQNISSSAAIISVNNTVYVGGGSIGNHVYTGKVYALNW